MPGVGGRRLFPRAKAVLATFQAFLGGNHFFSPLDDDDEDGADSQVQLMFSRERPYNYVISPSVCQAGIAKLIIPDRIGLTVGSGGRTSSPGSSANSRHQTAGSLRLELGRLEKCV